MTDHELAAAWEQQAAARHTSLHDALTGLPNRALLDDRLEHGFAQARRHDRSMAVMFLDLDKFKSINDTHGHDVGDFVLKTVAQRLTAVTRGDDTISRISGDEFLYLLTELRSEGNIVPVAEKILKAIRAPMNIQIHGVDTSLSINASIGISIYPQHGTSAGALINSADQAMYRAKQSGAGYALAGQ
jgi:diguanylate cyclase (GGDEF)-like protein